MNQSVTVVGAGLAGCEAAWQCAQRGAKVTLYEMKPEKRSPAHSSNLFCELVCSNSLPSKITGESTKQYSRQTPVFLRGEMLENIRVDS